MEQAYFDRVSRLYTNMSYTFMDNHGEETFTVTPDGWETEAGETKTWVELVLFAIAMDAPLTVSMVGRGRDPVVVVSVVKTLEKTISGDSMNCLLDRVAYELEMTRRDLAENK